MRASRHLLGCTQAPPSDADCPPDQLLILLSIVLESTHRPFLMSYCSQLHVILQHLRTLVRSCNVETDGSWLCTHIIFAALLHQQYWQDVSITVTGGMQVIDEFVRAVMGRWPRAVLQFEDFSMTNAHPLLQRYRDHHMVFNDDIQVTQLTKISKNGLARALPVLWRSTSKGQNAAARLVLKYLHGGLDLICCVWRGILVKRLN